MLVIIWRQYIVHLKIFTVITNNGDYQVAREGSATNYTGPEPVLRIKVNHKIHTKLVDI